MSRDNGYSANYPVRAPWVLAFLQSWLTEPSPPAGQTPGPGTLVLEPLERVRLRLKDWTEEVEVGEGQT